MITILLIILILAFFGGFTPLANRSGPFFGTGYYGGGGLGILIVLILLLILLR